MKSLVSPAPTTALLLLLFCVSCGVPSQPSESDGRKAIEAKIAGEAQGKIRLLSFTKTNGKKASGFGVEAYEMEWKGEIEFLEDCIWGGFRVFEGYWSGDFYTAPPDGRLNTHSIKYQGSKPQTKRQRVPINHILSFEKTEKGWRQFDTKEY
jgi:hypothetical protein